MVYAPKLVAVPYGNNNSPNPLNLKVHWLR